MLAYHALKFHTIKTKGSITVQDQHLLAWPGNLCRHREASPGTKTTHRAGIEPVALAMLLRCLRQLVHAHSHVAHQGNRCPPVDTHIFSREIEPDYVRPRWNKRRLTMIEAEIHARANGQDGICSFQGLAA